MTKKIYEDLLNPCGYGFDSENTAEDYQEVIEDLRLRVKQLENIVKSRR